MPLVLDAADENEWIKKDLSKDEVSKILSKKDFPEMKAHAVARLLTSKSRDESSSRLIGQYNYPDNDLSNNLK